jgi:hypothetical protein
VRMMASDRMPDIRPRPLLLFRQRPEMRVIDLVEARARSRVLGLAAILMFVYNQSNRGHGSPQTP